MHDPNEAIPIGNTGTLRILGPSADDILFLDSQLSDEQRLLAVMRTQKDLPETDLRFEFQTLEQNDAELKTSNDPGFTVFRCAHLNICLAASYLGIGNIQTKYIKESLQWLGILDNYELKSSNNQYVKLLWDDLWSIMLVSSTKRFDLAQKQCRIKIGDTDHTSKESWRAEEIELPLWQQKENHVEERHDYPDSAHSLQPAGIQVIARNDTVAATELSSQMNFCTVFPTTKLVETPNNADHGLQVKKRSLRSNDKASENTRPQRCERLRIGGTGHQTLSR